MVVGHAYMINHTRKGQFVIRVEQINGAWITGTIESGHASAAQPSNQRDAGESVQIREGLFEIIQEVE